MTGVQARHPRPFVATGMCSIVGPASGASIGAASSCLLREFRANPGTLHRAPASALHPHAGQVGAAAVATSRVDSFWCDAPCTASPCRAATATAAVAAGASLTLQPAGDQINRNPSPRAAPCPRHRRQVPGFLHPLLPPRSHRVPRHWCSHRPWTALASFRPRC